MKISNIDYHISINSNKSVLSHVLNLFKKSIKNERTIFSQAQLEIQKGYSYALLGPNGSGKTTLLRLISRSIHNNLKFENTFSILPFIGAKFPFINSVTAYQNVKIFLEITKHPADLNKIFSHYNLEEFKHEYIEKYSTGMLSRLALSIIKETVAELYLIDEIITYGDFKLRNDFEDLITKKCSEGAAFIIASHDINFIAKATNKAILLKDNKIIQSDDILNSISDYKGLC